jgi:hypothetical protein
MINFFLRLTKLKVFVNLLIMTRIFIKSERGGVQALETLANESCEHWKPKQSPARQIKEGAI